VEANQPCLAVFSVCGDKRKNVNYGEKALSCYIGC